MGILGIWHPSSVIFGEMVRSHEHGDWWLTLHLLQLPLFGLVAVSLFFLLDGIQNMFATVSRTDFECDSQLDGERTGAGIPVHLLLYSRVRSTVLGVFHVYQICARDPEILVYADENRGSGHGGDGAAAVYRQTVGNFSLFK